MFAGHAHGTTRMGSDPATSVADDTGLVHGTDNIFVAGAGLFVTSAGLNPLLTIVALAMRAVPAIAAAAAVCRRSRSRSSWRPGRSDRRRVGEECVRTCRSRVWADKLKKKT